MITRISNAAQSVLKRWGNTRVKRLIWDREFFNGRWDYIKYTNEDVIYQYLEKYCTNGNILDLGCGSGNTGNELDVTKYKRLTGIDISIEAVRQAQLRSAQNRRNDKNEYFAADISKYVPAGKYDIILFRESIYFTPNSRIKGMLNRYSDYLDKDGVFIARIYDRNKYRSLVSTIEDSYSVIEKYMAISTLAVIIVFRPRLLSD